MIYYFKIKDQCINEYDTKQFVYIGNTYLILLFGLIDNDVNHNDIPIIVFDYCQN